MGLIFQPPSFARYVDNQPSTPSVNLGTGVTAGANNADGTAVTGLSALAFEGQLIQIGISGFLISTGNSSALLDVLIDPAGGTSWASTPLIPTLLAGFSPAITITNAAIQPQWYTFPLRIPAGASIGLRARRAHSATITGRVVLRVWGENRNPASWWCGQKVTAVGINAASSRGTDHTAGDTVLSSWTDFGSTTTLDAGAVQWAAGGDSSGTQTATVYRFEYGAGGAGIGEHIHLGASSGETCAVFPRMPTFAQIPAGTQLQVRGISGGSPQAIDVAAYLVH